MNKGTLYLIPSLLAETQVSDVLPERTLLVIRNLECFIVEEVRTARRFLIRAGITRPIDSLRFLVFNEHSGTGEPEMYLSELLNGNDTGLLSEAGVPCVADPGSVIVQAAHHHGIRVVPLIGPSSLLLALTASGFNGQNFAFCGYLPTDRTQLAKRLHELEQRIREKDQTQIFIETPYRNMKLFETLVTVCHPGTMLCIAHSLTGPDESINTMTVAEWRKLKPALHKKPAIFLLYR
jgi:16S rRNA (cytidine1402-2'-O)-methyltransferase